MEVAMSHKRNGAAPAHPREGKRSGRFDRSLIIAVALLLTACAPHIKTEPADESSRQLDVVTMQELARIAPGTSLSRALSAIRPGIVYVRGTQAMVSVNGGPIVDASVLDDLRVEDIREVRLVRAGFSSRYAPMLIDGQMRVPDVLVITMAPRPNPRYDLPHLLHGIERMSAPC
jgi:hypothetical protein